MRHAERWLLVCIGLLSLMGEGCSLTEPDCGPHYPPRNVGSVRIAEGVWGDVWFWQGDFMPMCPTGTVKPVVREVLFYELTSMDSVVQDSVVQVGYGSFYSQVHSKLVGSTFSSAHGFFEIRLPPGTYSVFVREDSLLYSNLFDGEGHIFPVVVRKNEVTGIRFDIRYASTL
jgi:hypothetical protein